MRFSNDRVLFIASGKYFHFVFFLPFSLYRNVTVAIIKIIKHIGRVFEYDELPSP